MSDTTSKRAENDRAFAVVRAAVAEGDIGESTPAEHVFAEMRALIAERCAAQTGDRPPTSTT